MRFTARSLLLMLFLMSASPILGVRSNGSTEAMESASSMSVAQRWVSSGLSSTAITQEAFAKALAGYNNLLNEGLIEENSMLTIVDFSRPSNVERMAIYDVAHNEVVSTTLVAHGRNSGELMATSFSNIPQSFQSSLGFYLTAETYQGKHGYSLRLDGLEPGINDKARERAVVIHGAEYATEEFIHRYGRLGRSYGCPAIPESISTEVIDLIKEGQLLFIFAENEAYATGSSILKS